MSNIFEPLDANPFSLPDRLFPHYMGFVPKVDEKYKDFLECLLDFVQLREKQSLKITSALSKIIAGGINATWHDDVATVLDHDNGLFGVVVSSSSANVAAAIHNCQLSDIPLTWFFKFALQIILRSALLSEVRFAINGCRYSGKLSRVMNCAAQITYSSVPKAQVNLRDTVRAIRKRKCLPSQAELLANISLPSQAELLANISLPSQAELLSNITGVICANVPEIPLHIASRMATEALAAANAFVAAHADYKFIDRESDSRHLPSDYLGQVAAMLVRHFVLLEVQLFLFNLGGGDHLLAA